MQYFIKIFLSALIIVLVSELGKRFSLFAALVASLPLTSILALTWMYLEEQKVDSVILVSRDIFWLVLPSLVFFLVLPFLLKKGWNFWASMGSASGVMVGCYFLMLLAIKYLDLKS